MKPRKTFLILQEFEPNLQLQRKLSYFITLAEKSC